jgi:hypothetical protein
MYTKNLECRWCIEAMGEGAFIEEEVAAPLLSPFSLKFSTLHLA